MNINCHNETTMPLTFVEEVIRDYYLEQGLTEEGALQKAREESEILQ
ncbi:MAG: hypothetical protein GY696_23080 [Gammaproteobacteria bacterium]|nr:hypothetical protein [Gammaproteobacteria bacterium]